MPCHMPWHKNSLSLTARMGVASLSTIFLTPLQPSSSPSLFGYLTRYTYHTHTHTYTHTHKLHTLHIPRNLALEKVSDDPTCSQLLPTFYLGPHFLVTLRSLVAVNHVAAPYHVVPEILLEIPEPCPGNPALLNQPSSRVVNVSKGEGRDTKTVMKVGVRRSYRDLDKVHIGMSLWWSGKREQG